MGRVAIEGLGAAAWHLGMPAPEHARQLLLAVTNISTMMRKARCSAMMTIPAGDHNSPAAPAAKRLEAAHERLGGKSVAFIFPGQLLSLWRWHD